MAMSTATIRAESLSTEVGKRIEHAVYDRNTRTVAIRMGTGRVYALKVADLPEADPSEVTRVAVARNHRYIRISQRSGNRFELPWDAVLYHCEPEYEYYKGRADNGLEPGRAVRIGGRIRELREAKGLTITEVAQRAGMERPNLSRLEHGRHLPSLDTLERLAEALEVPVAALLARRDAEWKAAPMPVEPDSPMP